MSNNLLPSESTRPPLYLININPATYTKYSVLCSVLSKTSALNNVVSALGAISSSLLDCKCASFAEGGSELPQREHTGNSKHS